jgi:hypothetical protein
MMQRDGSRLIVISDAPGAYELQVAAGKTTLIRKGKFD